MTDTASAHAAFPLLFAPFTLNGVTLRNRICLTGHGTGMGRDNKPDARQIAYYAARAQGGVGLIMLGSQQIHPSSPGVTGLLCNYDDSIIPGLSEIAAAVHAHGAKIFGYLSHMGSATSARPGVVWSASETYERKYGDTPYAMTQDDMAVLCEAYAAAARRNLQAGMDGIEVHCGHGLLLAQFLSPRTNHRLDGYGGSPENRARFPAEVLQAVRAAIGPDVPLGIRISGDELVHDGMTVDDVAAVIPILVAAGALDFIDVSAGTDGDLVSNMLHEPPMGSPEAPYAQVAAALRRVAGVPIIHGTRIHTPAGAEQVLATGQADIVGMCRALIADPALPNKAMDGRLDDITPCVACEQACLGRLHRGRHISCVGNPRTGREIDYPTRSRHVRNEIAPTRSASTAQSPAAASPRKVLVIGGGPAGMEAAATAAERGCRVTLFDRATRLGGALHLASVPATRGEWLRLVAQRTTRLAQAGVQVQLDADVTPEGLQAYLEREGFGADDAIVVATGAQPSLPDRALLPGVELPHVLSIESVLARTLPAALEARLLNGERAEGQGAPRVLVIDLLDRQPGFATAVHLADAGCQVTLVNEAPFAGAKMEVQNYVHFHRLALTRGVTILPHTQISAIDADGVVTRDSYTRLSARLDGFEAVVIAAPGRADPTRHALAAVAAAAGVPTHFIGNCVTPRDVEAAILDGFTIGQALGADAKVEVDRPSVTRASAPHVAGVNAR
ncbi:FAD-dependent oxidoreductase [Robbsia sp. KACC 23696]|uniref:oxidoreductase n=1 Tax=Robbsia sp. KACC 23696 TaxID=3149231 RepID=UPI00325C1C5C